MDAVLIINALTEATKVALALYDEYEQGRVILSETDAADLKAALIAAKDTTERLRKIADDALDAAIARGD